MSCKYCVVLSPRTLDVRLHIVASSKEEAVDAAIRKMEESKTPNTSIGYDVVNVWSMGEIVEEIKRNEN